MGKGDMRSSGWTFAQVPIWAICDPDISDGAKAQLGYLKYRQGTDAACWPSKATIAGDMGVSVDTVERRTSELVAAGYVRRIQRPGRSNLYHLIADPGGKREAWERRETSRRAEKDPPADLQGGSGAPPADLPQGGGADLREGGGADLPPHDDNHGQEKLDDSLGAPDGAQHDQLDPSPLTIEELKTLERTRSQWKRMLEREREGKDRKGAVKYMEDKLWGSKHPAIQIYQEVMGHYPRRNQFKETIERVGDNPERHAFWRDVVTAWKMLPYNPYNLAGMIDCFNDGRIPATGNGGTNGRDRRGSSRPGGGAKGARGGQRTGWEGITPEQAQRRNEKLKRAYEARDSA